METCDRIRTLVARTSSKKGLSRAIPAVAQILTRREDAELREFEERLWRRDHRKNPGLSFRLTRNIVLHSQKSVPPVTMERSAWEEVGT